MKMTTAMTKSMLALWRGLVAQDAGDGLCQLAVEQTRLRIPTNLAPIALTTLSFLIVQFCCSLSPCRRYAFMLIVVQSLVLQCYRPHAVLLYCITAGTVLLLLATNQMWQKLCDGNGNQQSARLRLASLVDLSWSSQVIGPVSQCVAFLAVSWICVLCHRTTMGWSDDDVDGCAVACD